MKFIHCADLHLGNSFEGLNGVSDSQMKILIDSGIDALNQMVDIAINEEIDFILFVGDIFDNHKINITIQLKLRDIFEKLEKHGIYVFLSLGNHDFQDLDNYSFYFPENVYVFPNQVSTKKVIIKNEEIAVTGFSYKKRWVDRQIQSYPKRLDVKWHIGMLHGSVFEEDNLQNYAPFKVSELISKNYDYWALGHIHSYHELSTLPSIIYPGSLQGKNNKEITKKGFVIVESKDGKLCPRFRELTVLKWVTLNLKVVKEQTFSEIEDTMIKSIEKQTVEESKLVIVSVVINVLSPNAELVKNLQNGYMLRSLRRRMDEKIFIRKISYTTEAFFGDNMLDENILLDVKNKIFEKSIILNLLGNLKEYEFIEEYFKNENELEDIFEKTKLKLSGDIDSYENFRS
ncbi:metallophosphoesterase family protein [Liquorilactobacillus cacaonum]|uniref:DNA repair exonuclease n=1 Tax=Liquorilactobacillus cacaonum DSM 21116 TaxID=1423729 RepID=A0A0R2CF22_9LACO|nr:DNA repair exonuclease [Liquorilactobacillus cacaonum]KRM90350.1 DNA repair exonuclease [Liquorilactobacillus cacaonum DSM 21116]